MMNSPNDPYVSPAALPNQATPRVRRRLSVMSVIVIAMLTTASGLIAFCCTCIPIGAMTYGSINNVGESAATWIMLAPWIVGAIAAMVVGTLVCMLLKRSLATKVCGDDPSGSLNTVPGASSGTSPVDMPSTKPDDDTGEHTR